MLYISYVRASRKKHWISNMLSKFVTFFLIIMEIKFGTVRRIEFPVWSRCFLAELLWLKVFIKIVDDSRLECNLNVWSLSRCVLGVWPVNSFHPFTLSCVAHSRNWSFLFWMLVFIHLYNSDLLSYLYLCDVKSWILKQARYQTIL